MKHLRYIFLAIIALIFVPTAFSQQTFVGKVVEVVDGKTAVIELETKKRVTAELEYIEIPEPEQQMRDTVKNHLQNLLLGKTVEFVARALMPTRLVGKIYLGNVDISQQLLRDGAAWYAIPEKKYQDPTESQNYQIVEAQAKLEKRGVWNVENLKPAWEFRAEKIKKEQEALAQTVTIEDVSTKPAKTIKRQTVTDQQKANAKVELWANVSGSEAVKVGGAVGLYSGYNAAANIGYTFTDGALFNLTSGKTTHKVESKLFYVHQGQQSNGVQAGFVMAFLSESVNYRFAKLNNLTIIVDGKKYALGKAIRFNRADGSRTQELLAYKIERETLEKISKAKKVKFTIGTFAGEIKESYQILIDKLVENSI